MPKEQLINTIPAFFDLNEGRPCNVDWGKIVKVLGSKFFLKKIVKALFLEIAPYNPQLTLANFKNCYLEVRNNPKYNSSQCSVAFTLRFDYFLTVKLRSPDRTLLTPIVCFENIIFDQPIINFNSKVDTQKRILSDFKEEMRYVIYLTPIYMDKIVHEQARESIVRQA